MLSRLLRRLVGGRATGRTRTHVERARDAQRSGDHAQAQASWVAAIRAAPDSVEAHLGYGQFSLERGDWKQALAPFECAAALAPDDPEVRAALARALLHADKPLRARAHCDAALAVDATHDARALAHEIDARLASGYAASSASTYGEAFRMALALPHIPQSRDEIRTVRTELERSLGELAAAGPTIDDPPNEVGLTAFYLAYHGENDRALQESIAATHLAACPALAYVAPHCTHAAPRRDDRLRVGLVSDYFHDHSIGRVTRGLVEELDRARFSVHVFGFREPVDATSGAIARAADESIVLPRNLAGARERVAASALDLLLYPDIGMEPLTYFMAFARLAPVQCTTWGHPVTTGVPALDWFISTDYFEADGAAAHYGERLFMLRDVALPGYYHRPAMPARASPADAGFDPARRTYFCPQALFKLHPDFDPMLAEILRRDRGGDLVLVYDERTDLFHRPALEARLKRTAADVYDRIVFLPRAATREGYLARLMCADVVLDTPHYCGGNTSLEAISAGTPVVTLPGTFNRGRQTYAFFRRMRFEDTVAGSAQDYVDKAIRIATDRDYRAQLVAAQANRAHALYEDAGAIRQIEDFFERACADRQAGSG